MYCYTLLLHPIAIECQYKFASEVVSFVELADLIQSLWQKSRLPLDICFGYNGLVAS